MFLRDAAGPPAGEVAAERFGSADAPEPLIERAAAAFVDQGVQLGEAPLVIALPPEIFAPRARGEGDFHAGSISACSSPPPASSSAMDSSSRLALAGERSRYRVSCMLSQSLWETSTTASPRWRVMITGA